MAQKSISRATPQGSGSTSTTKAGKRVVATFGLVVLLFGLALPPFAPGAWSSRTSSDLPRAVDSAFSTLAPPLTLVVNLTGPDSLSLGGVATFHAQPTGGNGPFQYRWIVGGTASNWTNTSTDLFRPLQDAIYLVNVTARNATNATAYAAKDLVVMGASPIVVTLQVVSVDGSGRATLDATVTGGLGPYHFNWSASGGSGGWSTSPRFTTAPLHPGKNALGAGVIDSYGYRAASVVEVEYTVHTVSEAPTWAYIGLAVGVAGGVAVGVGIVALRRGKR